MRNRQKGVLCSVDGCDDWCVGNDLCQKHNQALHRYGSVYGKEETDRDCEWCGKVFRSKYDSAVYCSDKCRNSVPERKRARYLAVKKWRDANIEKARLRDSLGKRTKRRFKEVENCVIVSCEEVGERHHPDYDKPYEIVWLCRKHHRAVHTESNQVEFREADIRSDKEWKESYLRNIHKFDS